MRSLLLAAAALSLAFAPAAYAKTQCKDAAGKFTKCPAASSTAPTKSASPSKSASTSTAASSAASATSASTSGGHPHCSKGKPCGNACIANDKVCHK